jgi:CheY-like chemotaxis protein
MRQAGGRLVRNDNMRKRLSPATASELGVKCVLLAVHDDSTRLKTKWTLTDFGYQVDVTRAADEALALFDPALHDVVVAADTLPGITGAELAHIIKLRSSRTPVVLLTRRGPPSDRSCLDAVLEAGAWVCGLTSVLQNLLAASPKVANPAFSKSQGKARCRRKPRPDFVPEGRLRADVSGRYQPPPAAQIRIPKAETRKKAEYRSHAHAGNAEG